jgi:chemotaxis protein methyltransferase CheR
MYDNSLSQIADFIYQRSRLAFPGRKKTFMRSKIQERLETLNISDFTSYLQLLQTSEEETFKLVDILTVNETFFFRNQNQFDFLSRKIIPELEYSKGMELMKRWGEATQPSPKSIMRLRILSAGCSTGEEPYSLAMSLLESLRFPKAWEIEIIAGDISETCLQSAARGFYEKEKLRNVPFVLRNKYFEESDEGYYVNNDVKGLVRFIPLNLHNLIVGDGLPGFDRQFDIIFCRNVLIYFSPNSQQQLISTLYNLLVDGGYLFTGDAEPLHLYEHDFKLVEDEKTLVYKKISVEENANVI